MQNTLFYGDNIDFLTGIDEQGKPYIPTESVDLVYLDPPFNSNRAYNIIYRHDDAHDAPSASMQSFTDTWTWAGVAAKTYHATIRSGVTPEPIRRFLEAMKEVLGYSEMMAYLAMMTPRLMELHRVLKPTGSLYLHCDPTASHYLKIVLDTIFGAANFRNEITWKRADAHNDAKKQFGMTSDRLLFYSKTKDASFQRQYGGFQKKTLRDWYLYLEFTDGIVRRMTKEERETQRIPVNARRFNTSDLRSPNPRPNLMYEYKGYRPHRNGWAVSPEKMAELDANGLLLFPSSHDGRIMRKRYLDEQAGAVLGDVWTDISQLRGADAERLGYPTQKPLALLKRIIAASTEPGDVVFDPFCGCGTAVAAAQEMNRKWLGIDITYLAVNVIEKRMQAGPYNLVRGRDYKLLGIPRDLHDAQQLADTDTEQFEYWALSQIDARPYEGKQKKGADKGRDGVLVFDEGPHLPVRRAIVSVKSGKVGSEHIRDLRGVIERDKADLGIFVTLRPPTGPMKDEASEAGMYAAAFALEEVPRIQILTVAGLLNKTERVQLPRGVPTRTHEQFAETKPKKQPRRRAPAIKEGQGVLVAAVAMDSGMKEVQPATEAITRRKQRSA